MSLFRFCKIVLLNMTFLSCVASAQSNDTILHGRVLDPTGAAIAGATVTAKPEKPGADVSTVSGPEGEFRLVIRPGKYNVKVIAPGFLDKTTAVDFERPTEEVQKFTLEVAGVETNVTVTEMVSYQVEAITSATKTLTPLRDVPQSIAIVTQQQVRDQLMLSVADVVRYIPGISAHQGENNRDQVIIRGNSTSADFFINGVRDDVQYYRDLYNLERVEALKGPNAMIFGRGGGGGVINRVSKEAVFTPIREVTLTGGSHDNKRVTTDFDRAVTGNIAFRVNGMYENSDSFRDHVDLERYGISPTLSVASASGTKFTAGYEHFRDNRVADRGITSFGGRPAEVAIGTYYGDPDNSRVRARVNLFSTALQRDFRHFNVQDRTSFGNYNRFYQNFVPGAPDAAKTIVALSTYNNATVRRNVFNQSDVSGRLSTPGITHTLLAGAEIGRQRTNNFRNTGFFNNTVTSISVPYSNPTLNSNVTYRQSPTDADNRVRTKIAATYVQDQIELSRYVQVITGLRFDYFDLQFHNNRTAEDLRRIDRLTSPRVGVVLKPTTLMSVYGNYNVSYLPSSGDQFSSLTTITQQVKPEKFSNYEVGVKWDLHRELSLTAAVYRLDRTNTRSTDPNDPTRIVQTGRTRSDGYEIGVNGRIVRSWMVAGGYAYQDAFIANETSVAPAGARVAQVPRHTFSLWNNYQFVPRVGAGLGLVHRADMYATIDNTIILPSYTRADAALFVSLSERMRLQTNIENLFNAQYYQNADSNTNISPGAARSFRLGLTARF